MRTKGGIKLVMEVVEGYGFVTCNLTANQSIEILTRDGHDDLVPIVSTDGSGPLNKLRKWCCVTSGQIGLPGSLRRISPWEARALPYTKPLLVLIESLKV
jgi:hypothetical protein